MLVMKVLSGSAIVGSYWINLTATSVNGFVISNNYTMEVICSSCVVVPPLNGSTILNPEITVLAGLVMIGGFIGAWTSKKKKTKWIFAVIIALGTIVFFYYDGQKVLEWVWSWFADFQLLNLDGE